MPAPPTTKPIAPILFSAVAGLFFFVAIVKFGSPVILDDVIVPPNGALAAVFETWKIKWGYLLMIPVVMAGLPATPWKKLSWRWPLVLPLVWFGWQFFVSAPHSVGHRLTDLALQHFAACCVFYYLGCFAWRGPMWPVCTGMALGLCWAMRMGLEQHFGGLEATRKLMYSIQPNDPQAALLHDPNYLKRIASARIFGTFSNADALAEAIELLMPMAMIFVWQLTPKVRPAMRWAFVGILGGVGLACLYWTGSKAGWLVVLIMGVIALWHARIPPKWKWLAVVGLVVLGLAGFGWRMATSANKQKEKASVVTRYSYWKAALQVVRENPLTGSGPGTFSIAYAKVIGPSEDFARLCHNDYIEQASDGGIPAAIAYLGLVAAAVIYLYRYRVKNGMKLDLFFGIWLGILGLALHAAVDYPLYIPALAWPAFFLMGFALKSED